jgi:hypothetical protein
MRQQFSGIGGRHRDPLSSWLRRNTTGALLYDIMNAGLVRNAATGNHETGASGSGRTWFAGIELP